MTLVVKMQQLFRSGVRLIFVNVLFPPLPSSYSPTETQDYRHAITDVPEIRTTIKFLGFLDSLF